jgi:uncharacterized protein (TIGR02594 family)
MGFNQKRVALALCAVALATVATQAFAKPSHRRHVDRQAAVEQSSGPVADSDRYPVIENAPARRVKLRGQRADAESEAVDVAPAAATSNSLVNQARRYIGGNPTGRSSLWCGAFMDMVLKQTGHRGGGNLASAYARYGTRVSGPQVGAIAVMGRNGGGHVGVVSGIDANGNPIIISGNHNRRVAESVYPRGRIYAYVLPN